MPVETKKKPGLKKKRRALTRPPSSVQPVHSWRVCPAGQHYREGSEVDDYTRNDGTQVSAHARKGTCANNPSGKDQLYSEEMRRIEEKYFGRFKSKPLPDLPKFKEKGRAYDHLIRGWTKYWNDVLKPNEPLDPRLVKALIASESGFERNAWNKLKGRERARGLAQVLDGTLPLLKNPKELTDHHLHLKEDDMLDPSLSISAGIRWLFRKKEIMESKSRKPVSWRDAAIGYKGLNLQNPRHQELLKRFDGYFEKLSGKGR
jgi:hypothetical protein